MRQLCLATKLKKCVVEKNKKQQLLTDLSFLGEFNL